MFLLWPITQWHAKCVMQVHRGHGGSTSLYFNFCVTERGRWSDWRFGTEKEPTVATRQEDGQNSEPVRSDSDGEQKETSLHLSGTEPLSSKLQPETSLSMLYHVSLKGNNCHNSFQCKPVKDYNSSSHPQKLAGLGGLVIIVLDIGPKVWGFIHGRDNECLRVIKIHSTTFFGEKTRPSVLCRKTLRRVKRYLVGEIHGRFSPSFSLIRF
jgi:hypothetical protein